MSTAELMQQFRKPGILERLITGEFFLPGPADEDTLRATEARIGRKLPDDHRAALGVYDGYTVAMLLPSDKIQPATDLEANNIDFLVETGASAGYAGFSHGHLQSCWVVGGNLIQMPDDEAVELYASLLWCPDLPADYHYLSSISQTFYPTFRDALFEHAVRMGGY